MKVDFYQNQADIEAALLGSLGFSTSYIEARTRLTKCQVQYRLGKAHIKRADYRNGTNVLARKVVDATRQLAQTDIASKLRKAMGHAAKPPLKLRRA